MQGASLTAVVKLHTYLHVQARAVRQAAKGIDPLIVRSRLAIIDEWSDMCSVYLSERNDAEAAQARVTPIHSNAVN